MSAPTAVDVQALLRRTARALPNARTVAALQALLAPLVAADVPMLSEISCTGDDGQRLLVCQMRRQLEDLIEEHSLHTS